MLFYPCMTFLSNSFSLSLSLSLMHTLYSLFALLRLGTFFSRYVFCSIGHTTVSYPTSFPHWTLRDGNFSFFFVSNVVAIGRMESFGKVSGKHAVFSITGAPLMRNHLHIAFWRLHHVILKFFDLTASRERTQ